MRADIAWLRRHRRFKRWSERRQVLFERRLMMVAFQIRVLLDRPKVDGQVRGTVLPAQFYRKIGAGPVTLLNAIDFEEHFDVENPTDIALPVREVCNQLIHHYVMFAVGRGAGAFEILVVFSDYKRHVGMYQADVRRVIELFALFAAEASHANHLSMTWNERRQDYDYSTDANQASPPDS